MVFAARIDCFNFFDTHVGSATKMLMITAIQNEDDTEQGHTKRTSVDLDKFIDNNLEELISAKSRIMFELMELPDTFLTVHLNRWKDREDYQKRLQSQYMPLKLSTTMQNATLIQEFGGLLTHDESQSPSVFATSCSAAPLGLSRHQERDTLCLYQDKLRKLH